MMPPQGAVITVNARGCTIVTPRNAVSHAGERAFERVQQEAPAFLFGDAARDIAGEYRVAERYRDAFRAREFAETRIRLESAVYPYRHDGGERFCRYQRDPALERADVPVVRAFALGKNQDAETLPNELHDVPQKARGAVFIFLAHRNRPQRAEQRREGPKFKNAVPRYEPYRVGKQHPDERRVEITLVVGCQYDRLAPVVRQKFFEARKPPHRQAVIQKKIHPEKYLSEPEQHLNFLPFALTVIIILLYGDYPKRACYGMLIFKRVVQKLNLPRRHRL
jgi:hypothetical protein